MMGVMPAAGGATLPSERATIPRAEAPVSVTDWALTLLCWAAALGWVVLFVGAARGVARLERLTEVRLSPPAQWPKLSVVIAACNEGETLRAALATLSSQDYPNLQLVVVDDRSTDETPSIVDEAARRDPRVLPLHVTELPEGWLGKVHALDVGAKHATGDWVLFTDADVHFAKGALQKAVALAEERRLDHVVLIPELQAGSFWHEVTLDAFGVMFLSTVRPGAIADPDSEAYVGSGAFNLVRRSKFEATEGFQWLRMEVADDLGVGLLLRRAGGRAQLLIGVGEVSVLWYPSLLAMVHGLEKNLFAVTGQYRAFHALLRLSVVPLFVLGPFLGLLLDPPLIWPAAIAVGSVPVLAWSLRSLGQRFWPALLTPVGIPIIALMAVRSMVICLRTGGIRWRGTHYPLDQLRALQRVKL